MPQTIRLLVIVSHCIGYNSVIYQRTVNYAIKVSYINSISTFYFGVIHAQTSALFSFTLITIRTVYFSIIRLVRNCIAVSFTVRPIHYSTFVFIYKQTCQFFYLNISLSTLKPFIIMPLIFQTCYLLYFCALDHLQLDS